MSTVTIPFLVDSESLGVQAKGARDVILEDIEAAKLNSGLRAACQNLAQAFEGLRKVGDFELEKVTIGIEITAEGGVAFIGTAKVGGSAAIQLEFIRPKPAAPDPAAP